MSAQRKQPIPEATVEKARSADLVGLVERYTGKSMRKVGNEYEACCPFHDDSTPSFRVFFGDGGVWRFHCFGCQADGDAIEFVMQHEGVPFHEAVQSIAGNIQPTGAAPQQRQVDRRPQQVEWQPITPVPADAPPPPMSLDFGREPDAHWLYPDADGKVIGYIRRFNKAGGKKVIMPLSYCVQPSTGEIAWQSQAFGKPRPIYGLDKLVKHPKAQVIGVEGEKACDKAQQRYEERGISRDKLITISWPGGTGGAGYVDWSPLAGRSVGLWPDADQHVYKPEHQRAGEEMPLIEQPGTACMIGIANQLLGIAGSVKVITPPTGVFDGWDLGDDLPENFDLLAHTKANAVEFVKFREQNAVAAPAASERASEPAVVEVDAGVQTQPTNHNGVTAAVDHVQQIASSIKARLVNALEIDPDNEDSIRRLGIDTEVIKRMISGSFWSGSKSKLFLLNDVQNLNQFLGGDAYKFLVKTFGSPVDANAIDILADEAIAAQGLEKRQEKALRKTAAGVAGAVILDHLKHHNQRDGVEWRCDMFASEAKMQLIEDKARVVLAHKPFEVCGNYEQAIIDDYKQHFTRFDEFLEFLVQSRFALDRKKCYLWLLADSDWGKGFLLGVLNSLRLSVSTSMKEIEAMFEGRPVGRAPEEFKRAFVLVVDEFKTVKSELKQLQSEITLAPKNQLTASVEVFAKLFLSAESVASLVTENGVEDQFANRMSIFQETGSLVSRELYIKVGNPRYFASILAYAAETMNMLVAKMQAVGRLEAQTNAESWINGFIKKHGIDTVYDRFSESLPGVADEVLRWLHKQHDNKGGYLLKDDADDKSINYYLPSANKRLDEYLFEHFDASEVHAYRRRKQDILKSMSGDGKGSYPHAVNGHQVKAVMLKKIGESDHPLYD